MNLAATSLSLSISTTVIPDTVVAINHYAFCNCSGLQSITIPDNVNLLKERYPAVCGSATEAIDLSLRYWQALCADDRHLSYVVARVRGMRGDARR